MTNPFDQFDAPGGAPATQNPFDQFDAPAAQKKPTGAEAAIRDNLKDNPITADSPWEAFASGWNMSASDIAARVVSGNRKPGMVLPQDAGLFYKGLNMAGRVVGDLPATAAGFVAGAFGGAAAAGAAGSVVPVAGTAAGAVVGGTIGAGATSAMFPEAMRQVYAASIGSGKIKTFGDFVATTTKVVLETGKAGVIGGVTAPIGGVVGGRVLAATGSAAKSALADGLTQAVTGTAIGGAMDGHVPDADDFLVAAGGAIGFHAASVTVGGVKKLVPVPKAGAEKVAGNLRAIYAETGLAPWEALEQAKSDPVLAQQMLGETPDGKPFVQQAHRYAKTEPEPFKQPPEPETPAKALPAAPYDPVVRLYRGEGSLDAPRSPGAAPDGQLWYTPDRSRAEKYAKKAGGTLYHLEMPRSEAKALLKGADAAWISSEMNATRRMTGGEAFFNDWHGQAPGEFGPDAGDKPAKIGDLVAYTEGSAVYAKRRGIPEKDVVSSADAVGRYQVTPGTAHQYMGGAFFGVGKVYNKADPGMKSAIMEKLKDPEVNQKVADKILVDLTKRYKLPSGAVDVEAVLIAYNAGPGTANRFIRKGRSYDTLPTETQRYLNRAEGFKGKVDRGIEEPPPVKAPEPEC